MKISTPTDCHSGQVPDTSHAARSCGCSDVSASRRDFLKVGGLTAAAIAAGRVPSMAGPFDPKDSNAIIPADKKLRLDWMEGLYHRGQSLTASGADLQRIGMPISGLCTGQVYLGGDGRLWLWNLDATKDKKANPKGRRYMEPDLAHSPVGQGFALQIDGRTQTLDADGFHDVRFTNQYPMGRVDYADPDCPVTVRLEAWTPYIPLSRDESSYPAIVMRYTLTNPTEAAHAVALAGWIDNFSNRKSGKDQAGEKVSVYHQRPGLAAVECSTRFPETPGVENQPDHGTFALGLFGEAAPDMVDLAQSTPGVDGLFMCGAAVVDGDSAHRSFSESVASSLGRRFTLEPGASQTVSFVLSWRFEHIRYGIVFGIKPESTAPGRNHYATLFPSAIDATAAVARREGELYGTTKQWVDTWYGSTLPHWLLERAFIPINSMQTQAAQRVYPEGSDTEIYNLEEGVRCCPGNCTHVWNYAQGLARIFPEIERECRDKIEYGLGFRPDTGLIYFRYTMQDNPNRDEAVDGACGTIIRVLRESQMTTDYRFLASMWDRVKLSMDHVIEEWDADEDGMLEGSQQNTLDEPWFGQVPWLINVYHAALKATAVMARQMKQPDVAKRYEKVVAKGVSAMVEQLWNEDFGYFIHKPPADETKMHGSTNGCHIDQVLGESWLHEVGLDPILPKDKVKKALGSLWKYNFTPDVGAFRKVMTNGRWYAAEGDAGLVMCSFPNGKIEPKSGKKSYAGYLNECMTGFEWQVAAHMIREGMLEEGLAIGKAIYDRYLPSARNPYNEVECSDHYSRAMASYSAFLAVCGYKYDGPQGKLAFGPKMQQDNFKAAFTTAEGWGRFTQTVEGQQQTNTIEIQYGKLQLKQLTLDKAPATEIGTVSASADGQAIEVQASSNGETTTLAFPRGLEITAGQALEVKHG